VVICCYLSFNVVNPIVKKNEITINGCYESSPIDRFIGLTTSFTMVWLWLLMIMSDYLWADMGMVINGYVRHSTHSG